ncbi:MAG: CUB domain-containing protein, partial [Bacteroidota bacterium]
KTFPTCGDSFTDPGGADANYPINQYSQIRICPEAPGDYVELDFSEFELAACCASLGISDNIFYQTFTGTNSPGKVVSNSPDGCLNLTFQSNDGQTAPGWQAAVNCISCAFPNAVVGGSATFSTIYFSWTGLPDATGYEWEVGLPGFTPGTGAAADAGSTSDLFATAQGLESSTEYEIYVRTRCGGSDWSAFSKPIKYVTAPTCGDHFYDPGGVNGNYQPYIQSITTICPDVPGQSVEVTFNTFQIHGWEDYFYVFDGDNTSAPVIGQYFGTNLPPVLTAANPSGCLTFSFSPQSGQSFAGWDAEVSCVACAKVSGVAVSEVGAGSATLTWNALPGGTASYEWEVGLPGFAAGTGAAIASGTSTSTTVQVSGLESAMSYEVYVRGDCGSNGFGNFSAAAAFKTAVACGDFFYDSGGPNGNYNNGESYVTTICPHSPGQTLEVIFTEFSTEGCCDYLAIYDGSSTAGIYLGSYSGGNIPPTIVGTSASGCITFSWYSDGSSVSSGWVAEVNCAGCVAPLNFSTSDIASDGATLSWEALPEATSYHWEVGAPGFMPGIGASQFIGNIASNSVDLAGLAAGANYEAYVRGICGSEGPGEFAGPLAFSTLLSCGSTMYDTGGKDGDYDAYEDYFVRICPEMAGDTAS